MTNTATAPFNEVTAILESASRPGRHPLRLLTAFRFEDPSQLGPAPEPAPPFRPSNVIRAENGLISAIRSSHTPARHLHSRPCGSTIRPVHVHICPRCWDECVHVALSFALTLLSWLEDE